jgi:hypothetical protein
MLWGDIYMHKLHTYVKSLVIFPFIITIFLYLSRADTLRVFVYYGYLDVNDLPTAKDLMFLIGTFLSILYTSYAMFVIKQKIPILWLQREYFKEKYFKERLIELVLQNICKSCENGTLKETTCMLISWLEETEIVIYIPYYTFSSRIKSLWLNIAGKNRDVNLLFTSLPSLTKVDKDKVYIQVNSKENTDPISSAYNKGVSMQNNINSRNLTSKQRHLYGDYKFWLASSYIVKKRADCEDGKVLAIISIGSKNRFPIDEPELQDALRLASISYIREIYLYLLNPKGGLPYEKAIQEFSAI